MSAKSRRRNYKNQGKDSKETLLYDLDWLEEGEKFPPANQVDRLERYEEHKMLFETKHDDVFVDALTRIQRIIGDARNVFINPVILNYNKLISIKTADLVTGEPPKITYGHGETKVIEEINRDTNISKLLYETVIDMSRFGDAIWRLYKGDDGKGEITIWEPGEWFPIVSPEDKKKITNHVLARKIYKGMDKATKQPKYELYVQIHEKGQYEERYYQMKPDGKTIGKLLSAEMIKTGFKDHLAVIHLPNVTTSDSVFGHDDYEPVNSIIAEIMVRFGQIQKILDKHASPSIQGSMEALQQNPVTGKWEFKMSNFFAKTPEDDPVEYLTWDGNLSSSFEEIEKLIDQLLTISEMGTALLGGIDSAGRATSGTSMRLRMVNPLMKASRLAKTLDGGLKEALSLISSMGYDPIEKYDITIEWQDGLPDDPMEEANVMAIRTGNKATISQKEAIMVLSDLSEEQALKMLDEIRSETPEVSEFGAFPVDDWDIDDEDDDEGDS